MAAKVTLKQDRAERRRAQKAAGRPAGQPQQMNITQLPLTQLEVLHSRAMRQAQGANVVLQAITEELARREQAGATQQPPKHPAAKEG